MSGREGVDKCPTLGRVPGNVCGAEVMAGAAVQAVSGRRLAQIGRAAAAAAGDDALIDNRSGGINCETRVDRSVLADMDDARRDCVGLGGGKTHACNAASTANGVRR